jgi:hypothetical protein
VLRASSLWQVQEVLIDVAERLEHSEKPDIAR